MTRHTTRRAGFTLLELLVVLSIMALLAAISVGAIGRYRVSAMEKQTDQSILKLDVGLKQQMTAVMDKAKNEAIPDGVMELTRSAGQGAIGGPYDNARARALHMKLRLQQELPQSFAEARAGVNITIMPSGLRVSYPNKQAIVQAIGAGGDTQVNEAAALLYLILSQGRGGQTFDVDSAAPVQTRRIAGRDMKIFVDAWDNPIVFRRTAANAETALLNELDNPPYVTADQMLSGNKDVTDPTGRLRTPAAGWHSNYYTQAVALFSNNAVLQPNPFDGTNRGPYISSAGRNGAFGDDDDQYSFRIQQFRKGN